MVIRRTRYLLCPLAVAICCEPGACLCTVLSQLLAASQCLKKLNVAITWCQKVCAEGLRVSCAAHNL